MDRNRILDWLHENAPDRLESLWAQADEIRRRHIGDEVHLRGLIEISNHCIRRCAYCGLRAPRAALPRYRMSVAEILDCARHAVERGYGTVVLQAGEDDALTAEWVADLVCRIKEETPLAVTLSLGERAEEELALWREAGADRYLLRFETANRGLFDKIHPPRCGIPCDRIALLQALRDLGYEVGSGVMVGIPGQSCDDLADDVEMFRLLDLDMIGLGPYIAHPSTPLGRDDASPSGREQAPHREIMTYKMLALARIACPYANIPSTTALATLNRTGGCELGLKRGANVVMPDLTPLSYRRLYEIYPAKACITDTTEDARHGLRYCIESLGRCVGRGRGDSPNWLRRSRHKSRGVPCLLCRP